MSELHTPACAGHKLGGTALLLCTLFCWSSVPLFLRYFTDYIDSWTANGWRYSMSALFWTPAVIWSIRRGTLPTSVWRAALLPSAFNIVGQSCFALALYYIYPGMLTFLLRLQIVFVAVGAYLLFPSERPILRSPGYLIGVGTVFGGLIGLCFLGSTPPSSVTAVGITLGVLSGIPFAGYSLTVRRCVQEIHPVHAFGVISLYTSAGLVLLMLAVGRAHGAEALALDLPRFLLLIASAMIGIAISHVTYYAAIARLGVSISAGVVLLQPFLCGAASYYLFDERLTREQWVSGAAALVGAGLMLKTQRRLQPGAQREEPPAVQKIALGSGSTLVGSCPQPAQSVD